MNMTISENRQHNAASGMPPIVNVKTSQSFPHEGNNETIEPITPDSEAQFAGEHLIVDFWGVQSLQDSDLIESALKDAASIAGAILLHIHLHQFSSGGGVTGVALLAESHISIHTWPERDYAAFDVFMCGDAQPEKAVAHLEQIFKPEKVLIKQILRGESV